MYTIYQVGSHPQHTETGWFRYPVATARDLHTAIEIVTRYDAKLRIPEADFAIWPRSGPPILLRNGRPILVSRRRCIHTAPKSH